jgi:uncharacterized protein YeeX (DUF496 family)
MHAIVHTLQSISRYFVIARTQIKRQQQDQMKSLRDNPIKYQELLRLVGWISRELQRYEHTQTVLTPQTWCVKDQHSVNPIHPGTPM